VGRGVVLVTRLKATEVLRISAALLLIKLAGC
jgi:hypothetical protein